MNSFCTWKLNYSMLTLMCHSRRMNSKIMQLHERCICIVYSDKTSSFENLLKKDGSVTIRIRTFQTLWQNNYDLRQNSYVAIPNVNSMHHGTKNLSNSGPRIWNLVLDKLKQLVEVHAFKKEIAKWKTKNVPCRLCKPCMPNFIFI